jgi:hypothetical protein
VLNVGTVVQCCNPRCPQYLLYECWFKCWPNSHVPLVQAALIMVAPHSKCTQLVHSSQHLERLGTLWLWHTVDNRVDNPSTLIVSGRNLQNSDF